MTPIQTSALTPITTPMTSPALTSQEAAQRRKAAKAKEAMATLQTLREQRSSANDEKKAAARKKVEDLKARIRALQMTAVGNPEAMARMAAQLARELGAAVKAYAAAGGSSAGLGGASAAAPQGEAETASSDEASAEAGVTQTGVTQTGITQTDPSGADPAEAETDASDKPAATRNDPYRQVIERQQAQAAEQARQSADKQADSKFASDVKGLLGQLKAILHQASAQAKRDGDRTASTEQQSAEKAVTEVTRALSDMETPLAGIGLGFSLQV